MNEEVIFKRYQFSEGDTYVIADVDFFKKTIKIRKPLFYRLIPWANAKYWEWVHVKNIAINTLRKRYGFTNIIEN